MPSPVVPNEPARLDALSSRDILDSHPEPGFEDVAELTSLICGTPTALVSVVDEHRRWLKARVGVSFCETSRDTAFCAHTILQRDILKVEDASLDPHFKGNPLVLGNPLIRFYACAPLVLPGGCCIGALCVLARRARRLTGEQREPPHRLGAITMSLILMRKLVVQQQCGARAAA